MRKFLFSTAVFCLMALGSFAQSNARSSLAPATSQRAGLDTSAPKTNNSSVQKKSASESTKTTPATKKTTIPASTSRTVQQPKVVAVKPIAVPQPQIQWMTIEEALEKSKTDKKKIFVDVFTDWCGWCKHMDSTTFKDAAIVTYLNEQYYAVKFNAEQQGDIVYKDKTYKFKRQGNRGYHELAALLLNNRLSYPSFVILNEDQDVIQPIPGYQDAKKLDIILHYFGTDNHKKTPWEKYERNYSKAK